MLILPSEDRPTKPKNSKPFFSDYYSKNTAESQPDLSIGGRFAF